MATARTRTVTDPGHAPAARNRRSAGALLALAAALFLFCGCPAQGREKPSAVRGVMDLSAWDFSSRGAVSLDGEWEFHWNRLLSPDDFRDPRLRGAAGYTIMPGFWNGRTVGGLTLPGHGFATMRLTVRLGGRRGILAMMIPQMHTAYILWINGKQASFNGKPGTDAAHEVPQFLQKMIIITPESETLELVLQVSNFHHPNGGMWSSMKLGTDTEIMSMQRHFSGFNSFLLGGLLLMALYHIGIFLFRRKDLASLFFGLLCLTMAVRIPFESDRMISWIIPGISWEINQKVSYLTFYIAVFITNLYLYHLFPEIYSRTLVRISTVIGIAFSAAVVVLTAQVYFYTRYPYYANFVFWSAYAMYVIVRAVIMKKEGAVFLLCGMVIMLSLAGVDILYYDRIISFGNVSIFGVMVFTLSQALLLSTRSSKAFTRIEILSFEKAHLFSGSINIISSILLANSTRLYEFTQSVTRIAVMLAGRLGFAPDSVEEIRIASLLHDIGMMGVPDDLLGRPYPVSDIERLIMENHPRKSIEIIENLKELSGVKSIIAQHHERYDGSGYPSRLAGNEITAGARIIGLVDDFVSMLGRREFQVKDKKERVIAELKRQRGLLYDPVFVDALVRLIDSANLVYIINEDDIRHERKDDISEWIFPSNVNYEMSVVGRVMAEMKARVDLGEEMTNLIEAGLGEIIRNAIIHGNKYDETKRITVGFAVREREGRRVLEFRIADQGGGMDHARYQHFKDGRLKLYDIARELKRSIPAQENAENRAALVSLEGKLRSFLLDYYINYNKYRQIDSPEATGGIGLFQVMQTFDSVDFRNIVQNHSLVGMEVVLEKYID